MDMVIHFFVVGVNKGIIKWKVAQLFPTLLNPLAASNNAFVLGVWTHRVVKCDIAVTRIIFGNVAGSILRHIIASNNTPVVGV